MLTILGNAALCFFAGYGAVSLVGDIFRFRSHGKAMKKLVEEMKAVRDEIEKNVKIQNDTYEFLTEMNGDVTPVDVPPLLKTQTPGKDYSKSLFPGK